MPKYLCPYCKNDLGAKPLTHCPHCGKAIIVPGRLRKTTFRQRQKMREKIEHDAEKQRRALVYNDIAPGRNPLIIGIILMVMIVVGGLVIGRANMIAGIKAGRLARIRDSEDELRALRIALERFREDCGRYPTAAEGLKALVINPGITNWGGNYVNIVKPDPWHTPYLYKQPGTNLLLMSAGPDRVFQTEDDLVPAAPTPDEIKRKPKNE